MMQNLMKKFDKDFYLKYKTYLQIGGLSVILLGITAGIIKLVKHSSNPDAAPITVYVMQPKKQSSITTVELPSTTQAFQDAALYSRTNGYIKEWHFDIGSTVKEGETLAEISAPDLDARVEQAKAAIQKAKAQIKITELNMNRATQLIKTKAASEQTLDQRQADYDSAKADLKAQEANLEQLQALQSYKEIVAPFSGTITSRKIDRGDLVIADNIGGNPLFTISDQSKLRIFVNVPQINALNIKEGDKVEVKFLEVDSPIEAKVSRLSKTIDPSSRTLLVEIDIDNVDSKLYPGMYCIVRLFIKSSHPVFEIPTNTIINRADGSYAAIATSKNRVHFKKLEVGRDLGKTVEVLSGLGGDENIILSPNADLNDQKKIIITKNREEGKA